MKNLLFLVLSFSLFYFSCSSRSVIKLDLREEREPEKGLTLQGMIVGQSDSLPVPAVTINLKGTSLETESLTDGSFSFTGVPPGYHTLKILKKGYIPDEKPIFITGADSTSLNLLIPVYNGVVELKDPYGQNQKLPELLERKNFINSEIDSLLELRYRVSEEITENLYEHIIMEHEDPYFKPFRDLYLTSDPDKCSPLSWKEEAFRAINEGLPEMELVEQFSFSLINFETGYIIEVDLESFKSSDDGSGILFKGLEDLNFVELTTSNRELLETWESNRRKRYFGSPEHFLNSLAEGNHISRGYRVYSGQFNQNNMSSYGSAFVFTGDVELKSEEYFKEDNFGRGFYLEYPNELKVEYLKKFMGSKYSYDGFQQLEYETSWLKLNSSKVYFSKNGALKNPRDITYSGVWGFSKLCDQLPLDYLPD